jgi:hypothetical protein
VEPVHELNIPKEEAAKFAGKCKPHTGKCLHPLAIISPFNRPMKLDQHDDHRVVTAMTLERSIMSWTSVASIGPMDKYSIAISQVRFAM